MTMSGGQEPDPPNALLVGSCSVQTDARSVNAFAMALGAAPRAGTVPHTFPISWLASDDVRTAMAHLEGLPIQTFQSFTYYKPLIVDTGYVLSIRLSSSGRVTAFSCDAKVRDLAGATVLEMKSEIMTAPNVAMARAVR